MCIRDLKRCSEEVFQGLFRNYLQTKLDFSLQSILDLTLTAKKAKILELTTKIKYIYTTLRSDFTRCA